MPYGNNRGMDQDVKKLKNKLAEQRPDLNVDNLSQNDMKNMLLNEINKNSNIDNSVKDKINKGDIDGLKEDIIKYLSKNKSSDGSTDELVKMLKDNDMDGLKNQLMGMLLGGMNQQKKNEIGGVTTDNPSNNFNLGSLAGLLNGIDMSSMLGIAMNYMAENKKNDARVHLLQSIRPFVSEVRQGSIDEAIRMISVISYFENFTGKVGG